MSVTAADSRWAGPVMRILYTLAGASAGAVGAVRGLLADGEEAEKRRQRRGLWPPRRTPGPWVWLQAASVGEADLALALARELGRRRPGLAFVVSSMTATGRARVIQDGSVESRWFPVDFAPFVKRIVDSDPPCLFVSVETEIWPETWRILQQRGVPTAVANARLSDRSVPRYRILGPFLAPLLARLDRVCARDDEAARRWVAIGAREAVVEVAGNIKFDLALRGEVAADTRLFAGEAPVFLGASTHEGEEAFVLDAFAKAGVSGGRLLLAPRHPERAARVLEEARARGFSARAWSSLGSVDLPRAWPEGADVVVVDCLGLLRSAYASAAAAFVGGSLRPGPGGHNLLEAVVAGCPVATGAFVGNVEDQASLLREGAALEQVLDVDGLARFFVQATENPVLWRTRVSSVKEVLSTRLGALERTVSALDALVDGAAARTER